MVLVHGLWMRGVALAFLGRRIGARGHTTRRFGYSSITDGLPRHVAALESFLGRNALARPHFVCHSMGGLVVQAFLASRPELPRTRVVVLGTPFQGSGVARTLCGNGATRWLIGPNAGTILTRGNREWPGRHPLGVIAGDRPYGVGVAVHRFDGPNDGTVAVSETRIPGMTDHIVVPSTHTGLVVSPSVAEYVCTFLRYEHF